MDNALDAALEWLAQKLDTDSHQVSCSILFPLVSKVVADVFLVCLLYSLLSWERLANFTMVPTWQSVGGSGISGPTACIAKPKTKNDPNLMCLCNSSGNLWKPKLIQRSIRNLKLYETPWFLPSLCGHRITPTSPFWRTHLREDMSREMLSWDQKNLETMLQNRSFLVCMQFSPLLPQIPQEFRPRSKLVLWRSKDDLVSDLPRLTKFACLPTPRSSAKSSVMNTTPGFYTSETFLGWSTHISNHFEHGVLFS